MYLNCITQKLQRYNYLKHKQNLIITLFCIYMTQYTRQNVISVVGAQMILKSNVPKLFA